MTIQYKRNIIFLHFDRDT